MDNGKFRGKYRNRSARNPSWDYTGAGRYFITICTHERMSYFGDIQNGVMKLSDIGAIVDYEWKQTGQKRPNIVLDEYVVMPDHFHAIIIIHNDEIGLRDRVIHNPHHHPEWKSGCLGVIVQQFKRACTHHIRNAGHPSFAWQPRFHDHIIRNDDEFDRIRRYIIDNPQKRDACIS